MKSFTYGEIEKKNMNVRNYEWNLSFHLQSYYNTLLKVTRILPLSSLAISRLIRFQILKQI